MDQGLLLSPSLKFFSTNAARLANPNTNPNPNPNPNPSPSPSPSPSPNPNQVKRTDEEIAALRAVRAAKRALTGAPPHDPNAGARR